MSRSRENPVIESATGLATVHAVISEFAAIVASARATLGAERSGNQLEMAEMDLLSAQASIEKACNGNGSRSSQCRRCPTVHPAMPYRAECRRRWSNPSHPGGCAAPADVHPDKDSANCSRSCRSLDSLRLWR